MLRSVLRILVKPSKFTLDNLVFRLHYRVTVGLLLACAVALLWKINYGKPISCVSRDDNDNIYLDDYCWYYSTYSFKKSIVGFEVPYGTYSAQQLKEGVDVSAPGLNRSREYHNVHRWIVVGILVQALFFYIPRVVWRCLEGRVITRLVWNMDGTQKDLVSTRKDLIFAFFESGSIKSVVFTFGYILCELLNLVNVFVQLLLVSHIMQTTFVGLDLLTQSRGERKDTSALVSFPLRVKCDFDKYGPSGDVKKSTFDCFMSVNGVIEVVFICQWIWFTFLTILSGLALFYRVVFIFIPPLSVLRLVTKVAVVRQGTVEKAYRKVGIFGGFVLYMLSKNMDPAHMKDILERIGEGQPGTGQSYRMSETVLLT